MAVVLGPGAHPVQRRHRREHVVEPGGGKVFLRQFVAHPDGRGVLYKMQGLRQFEAVIAHPLAGGQERVQHRDGNGDGRRYVGAGQETRLAAVQVDPVLQVQRRQTVEILVIADAFGNRGVFGV